MPEAADFNTYWEHVFRYAFACQQVKKLNVLDIASGEGYGTHALSQVAKSVIGVDISPEAVEHAQKKYGLVFKTGSAEQIPIESASLDAVVSFETIEHVPNPKKFVEEAFRVLKPEGLFIVSTPNKDVYLKGQAINPFHCSELTKSEFVSLLTPCFEIKYIVGQGLPTWLDDFQRIIGIFSNRLGLYFRQRIEQPFKKRFLPDNIATDIVKRQQIIRSIPTLSTPFNRLWNPYAISRLNDSAKRQPIYFIAVTTRRRSRV